MTVATDGQASLDTLRKQRFDLILMDCHMPGMDGFTATPLIRVLEAELGRPATPIVALTASAMSEGPAPNGLSWVFAAAAPP